jgi:hypothetical protein
MIDDEENEYAALRSYDALAAYIFKKHGADGVRTLFHEVGGFACEDFEQAIAVLEERGLGEVAEVMRDIAAEYPSGIDLNPYDPNDRCNWVHWRRSWLNRRRVVTGQVEKSLRAQQLRKQPRTQQTQH